MIFILGYQPRIIYLSELVKYKSVLLSLLSPRLSNFHEGDQEMMSLKAGKDSLIAKGKKISKILFCNFLLFH